MYKANWSSHLQINTCEKHFFFTAFSESSTWTKPFEQTYILVCAPSLYARSLTITRWHREARQPRLIRVYVFTLDVTLDDVCVYIAQASLDVVWGDVCTFFMCTQRKKACRGCVCARRWMVYVCKYPLSLVPNLGSLFAWLGVGSCVSDL